MLLAYSLKRCAFGYAILTSGFVGIHAYRDEAYRTRIFLAVLDHNAHLDCLPKKNQDSSYQYHRRFCQQTKNWDVVCVLEDKQYKYMSRLLQQIIDDWDFRMKNSRCECEPKVKHTKHHCKHRTT